MVKTVVVSADSKEICGTSFYKRAIWQYVKPKCIAKRSSGNRVTGVTKEDPLKQPALKTSLSKKASLQMSTLTIRKPRKANLRKNIKIMKKPYYLVSSAKPEHMITVHPPKSGKPGPNGDGKFPKDDLGRWVRLFTIEDSNSIKQFQRKRFLLLHHFPGEVAYFADEKGVKWEIEEIPGVHAIKARGKARRGFRAHTTAGRKPKSTGKRKTVQKTTPVEVIKKPVEKKKPVEAKLPTASVETTVPTAPIPAALVVNDHEPETITIVPAAGEDKPA